MDIDDKTLKHASELLRDNGINFWVCHGTLLGIIRENRLLPWDRDIDLAVWDHENDKEQVAKIFESKGYQKELFYADIDRPQGLHFITEGKNLDINFFKKSESMSSWQGAVVMEGFLNKLIIHIAHILFIKDVRKIKLPVSRIKVFFYLLFSGLLFLGRIVLPNSFKRKIHQSALKRFSYFGYSYPTELLVFKEIEYKGMTLQVPINSEKYLETTYGLDWKTPKKDYIWYEDASNLKRD